MGEDDSEDVGGGRRKKMRTTFTGKQVGILLCLVITCITCITCISM